MKRSKKIRSLRRDASGSVSVDWVVLTAAFVGLGIAVLTFVSGAADSGGMLSVPPAPAHADR